MLATDHEVVETSMLSSLPASTSCRVTWTSSGEGETSPDGMVMRDDQPGRVEADRLAEHLRDAQHRRVEGTFVHRVDLEHLVLAVHDDRAQLLLLQRAHIGQQQAGRVGGRLDAQALRGQSHDGAPAQLESRFELVRFAATDAAVATGQLCQRRFHQAIQALVAGQQRLGLTQVGQTQHDRQQLSAAQRGRAVTVQAFLGLFGGRQLADRDAGARCREKAHLCGRVHGLFLCPLCCVVSPGVVSVSQKQKVGRADVLSPPVCLADGLGVVGASPRSCVRRERPRSAWAAR